jgi:rfaE bifunctional protein kinase chain/domain
MEGAPTPRFADYAVAVGDTRLLVAGDVMLDRYWFGDVERISPEAPVPVVKVARHEERPGGAANVARNATALGCPTTLLSVIGGDEAGDALERLLKDAQVVTSLHRDPGVATTVKLRVIGRQQQLLRIDFETPPSHEVLASKLKDYASLVQAAGAVVLSDYGKGGLAHIVEMIALARAAKKPVLVDPKGDDWERYRGATLITPNRAELREVVGQWKSEEDLIARVTKLRADLQFKALLLTRSEEGMTLFSDDGILHASAVAREVYDVSGAGDTVIATLAAMLGAGLTLVEAVGLANRAAGIVVGKLGTATVDYDELFH